MQGRSLPDNAYPLADLRHIPDVDPVLRGAMQMPYLRRRRQLWLRRQRLPPTEHSPRFLYKFCSLRRSHPRPDGASPFDPESVERLRVYLVRSLLRLSSPDEFNDPFDLGAHWMIEGTVQERLARYRALIKQQIRGNFKERERAVSRLMTASTEELLSVVRGSYARQRSSFGICCFAGRDPANVLMWSHYAADHTGVCLQFELARDLPTFMRAVGVDYNDEYPTLNWIRPDFRDEMGPTLTRKHTRWAYEGERRILADGWAKTYLPFNPEALVGVIFGCRAGEDVTQAVSALLEERAGRGFPQIKYYYARQNPKRYELDIWSTPPTTTNPDQEIMERAKQL